MATEENRKDKKKKKKPSRKLTGAQLKSRSHDLEKVPGTECQKGCYLSKPGKRGKVYKSHHSISVKSGHEAEHGLCILLMGLSHGGLSTDIWTNVLPGE